MYLVDILVLIRGEVYLVDILVLVRGVRCI